MSLEVGQKAPSFIAKDQFGEDISLEDYKGKKVVLYFYPKDNTPGCTAQACNLRDHHDTLLLKGYEVIGVSTDSQKKHQNFINKYELPFRLIADEDQKVHELYGTWQLKKNFGKEYMGTVRTTFVINEEGVIEEIIKKVQTKNHVEQIIG